MKASGRFDPDYYVSQLRRIGFRRHLPLVHYLWSGERKGRRPFPDFSPLVYLTQHEEIIDANVSPLYHFITAQGRPAITVRTTSPEDFEAKLAAIVAGRVDTARRPLAIHIHIFYYHLVPEMFELLDRLDVAADLFFTIVEKPGFDAIAARIRARWPDGVVLASPNHGRDIYPFIALVNAGAFDRYALVGRIHTKKSVHRRDGDLWRRHLMTDILKNDGRVARIVARFAADPSCGIVVADGQYLTDERWWGESRARVGALCARIGITADDYPLGFPAGSMYWVRPSILAAFRRMQLAAADFEAESGQVDDTTAHAVERAMGTVARALGLTVVEVKDVI